eukprot:3441332-Rhodomonas_salina.1
MRMCGIPEKQFATYASQVPCPTSCVEVFFVGVVLRRRDLLSDYAVFCYLATPCFAIVLRCVLLSCYAIFSLFPRCVSYPATRRHVGSVRTGI